MTETSTIAGLEKLPGILPVFPLAGVLLLSPGQLPLNIFEPRYLAMVRDAMESHHLIGMMQPVDPASNAAQPELFSVGCAGRICEFSETSEGRILITLEGYCRFRIVNELEALTPYRQVQADYSDFQGDLGNFADVNIDRAALMAALDGFLHIENDPADLAALKALRDADLVNSIAMICPFSPAEKQALLEAVTLADRSQMLISLLNMMKQEIQGGTTLQ